MTCETPPVRATESPVTAYLSRKRSSPLVVASQPHQDDLLSHAMLDTPRAAAVASVLLKVPIIAEDDSLQILHGSMPDEISPSQSRVLQVDTEPATDAFHQSSPIITDAPAPPPKPSPPPRPDLSTFFVTITNAPVTQTILDTTTLTQTITLPAPPPPPSPASHPESISPKDAWSPPADFENLDCFGILKYGFGKSNLKVVHGIPASASVTAFAPVPTGRLEWTNDMAAIETFYPEGSINPGNSPQGGADFYANPLPALTSAQNVTFGYSVFLPVDFEAVRGGKLPGLYGGKTGCSGGDAALDCFSTRLMWRTNNDGELYLVSCLAFLFELQC
jgi:hypothetical protein